MAYAENTTVSVEKSRAEIEYLTGRYGASHFAYAIGPGKAQIEFIADDRRVRFILPLPDASDSKFKYKVDGRSGHKTVRKPDDAHKVWEQTCRSRWRSLCLAVKAKLEAVESGISTFESEFLAHIVNPANNRTVYEEMQPQIAANYDVAGESRPLQLTVETS